MATENRWDQIVALDFDRIRNIKSAQLPDPELDFLCKVDLRDVSPEDDFESIRLLLRIFQQGLRQSVEEKEAALYAKGRASQLLAEFRKTETVAGPPGPIQVAQPDAIRARDQHILYLQYEISQRDIQMQQLVEQAQQNRSQIEALDEQKRLTEEEIHHVRGQISKARDENDQLRLSIDSQLKKADAREKFYVKNDELIDALEEAANMRLEAQRLKNVCIHLEDQLRDAVLQIDSATNEHLRLKRLIESVENTCEDLREENSELRDKLNRGRTETSSDVVQSPEPSQSTSNAEDQLDQLISVVNKRVDEWKVMMQNQPDSFSKNDQANGKNYRDSDSAAPGETERRLAIRSQEVSVLRNSLTIAVQEIEEGAKTITRLKQQGRRSSGAETSDHLKTQLTQRTSELSSMLKRTVALEDDLDMCQRENKQLVYQIQRFEKGVYGLTEVRKELKDNQNQLLSREKYIKELVRRLNILTSDYDAVLADVNLMRRQSGLPPLQPNFNRKVNSMAALSDGRSLGEELENQFPSDLRQSERPVDDLLDDLQTLRQNFDNLVDENYQLEQSMQEIRDAIRQSRIHGLPGQSVELRSPSLEKLLKLLQRRRLPSSDSEFTEARLDSAVYSEPDHSQESAESSALKEKMEHILTIFEDMSTRNNRQLVTDTASNLSQKIFSLFNKSIQDVFKLVMDSDARSLHKLIGGHQQEIQLVLDDSISFHEDIVLEQKRNFEKLSRDYEKLLIRTENGRHSARRGKQSDISLPGSSTQTDSRHPQESLGRVSDIGQADFSDELRETEIRLARMMDSVTSLTSENDKLRSQLASASGLTFSEISQGLTTLEKDHRSEVDTLSRINGDLRADARRQEIRIGDLRSALQKANEQLADLTFELNHSQSIQPANPNPNSNPNPNPNSNPNSAFSQSVDVSDTAPSSSLNVEDQTGAEGRRRVLAQLQAKIQRLENELRSRQDDQQKERDEFVQILSQAGKGLQTDLHFSKQIAALNTELGQKDRRIEILNQQLEISKMDFQNNSENFSRREEDLRRERENVVSSYENKITRLQEELSKLKFQGASSSSAVVAAPDTGRTYDQPGGATIVPAQISESNLVKTLRNQLMEKEQELRKLSTAFQTFKDEMTVPSSDPTVFSQLASQKRELQSKLQTAQEANSKTLLQLRKEKTEMGKVSKELNGMRTELRQKDEVQRKFESMNGELAGRISSLEEKLHRARNGLTDDDRSVSELRQKIAKLEKSLAKSQSKSPARLPTSTQPEVLVWEEKKKWEKTVQKLKEKLKEKDDLTERLDTTIANTKEALARSERDRGLMEKRLSSLSKRLEDLSQQPSFLQQSLDASQNEIENLKSLINEQINEKDQMEGKLLQLQDRDESYASAFKVANDQMMRLRNKEVSLVQKQERSLKKVKALEERVLELETTIAEMKIEAVDLPVGQNSKDLVAAVRTLKAVIDEQQVELRHLKRQNSALKAPMKQAEEKGLRVQKRPVLEENTEKPRGVSIPGEGKVKPTRQKSLKVVKNKQNSRAEGAAADSFSSAGDPGTTDHKEEVMSLSRVDSYDSNRRVTELEVQLANILGERFTQGREKSRTKRRQER